MKAHIGFDARTGLTHSLETTPAKEHDLNQADRLLHGDEQFVFADAGYIGIDKLDNFKDKAVDWHIAKRPGIVRV